MHSRMRILIVDDDRDARFFFIQTVMLTGFDPLEARDANEAMCLLQNFPDIVLVLLDWMMPGKDGIEFLREIQALPDPPPVVMLTARTQKDDIVTALRSGAVDYIIKPVKVDILIEKINSVLGRQPEETKRRAERRKQVHYKANLSTEVVDISSKGCTIECSFPVPEGTVLILESEETSRAVNLSGNCRFNLRVVECIGKNNRYLLRTEFIGLTPHESSAINRACRTGAVV